MYYISVIRSFLAIGVLGQKQNKKCHFDLLFEAFFPLIRDKIMAIALHTANTLITPALLSPSRVLRRCSKSIDQKTPI
jgi:hypothetical protein